MHIGPEYVLDAAALAVATWAKFQSARSKRRVIQNKATIDAGQLQLTAWQGLITDLQQQLKDCRRSEGSLRTRMSAIHTKNIALEKVILGDFPRDVAIEILRAAELGTSSLTADDAGGGQSPAE